MTQDAKRTNMNPMDRGEIVVYQTEHGDVRLDVRLQDETIWLTQRLMAELFQTSVPNIAALEKKLGLWREQKRFLLNNLVSGALRLPGFLETAGGRNE